MDWLRCNLPVPKWPSAIPKRIIHNLIIWCKQHSNKAKPQYSRNLAYISLHSSHRDDNLSGRGVVTVFTKPYPLQTSPEYPRIKNNTSIKKCDLSLWRLNLVDRRYICSQAAWTLESWDGPWMSPDQANLTWMIRKPLHEVPYLWLIKFTCHVPKLSRPSVIGILHHQQSMH